MADLVGENVFKNTVRQLEPSDLAVPETWNPIHQDLLNNDVHLQQAKASQTDLTNHTGATATGTHGSTSAATANTLVHRDAAGRAKVAAPSAADDIARKQEVDAVQTNLTNHTGATVAGTHGSTAAATANTLMHRDANGRAKVAAPSAADDIARKADVDAMAWDNQVGANVAQTLLRNLQAVIVSTNDLHVVATAWDAKLRPTTYVLRTADGVTMVASMVLTYNADGNVATATIKNGAGATLQAYTFNWDGKKFLSRVPS